MLSFTHSEWRYRQSVDSGQVINLYRGSSRNSELAVSRLLYRDTLRHTTGSLRLWWRDSDNHINDAKLEQQRRHTAGWEFLLSHRERVRDGTPDASLAYRRGTGALGATAAPEQAYGSGSARLRIVRADAQLSLPPTDSSMPATRTPPR